LRFFEIIIGFCIANAWRIYLANHKKKSDPKYLTRASFQISLTKHFWDHNYSKTCRRIHNSPAATNSHSLLQTPSGSCPYKPNSKWRGSCAGNCKTIENRQKICSVTSYYCPSCQVFLHPGQCSTEYHNQIFSDPRENVPHPGLVAKIPEWENDIIIPKSKIFRPRKRKINEVAEI
jgi:hypothetical protein